MNSENVYEGKTMNEAVEKALKDLKACRDEVDIKVLDDDKRSFFSILEHKTVKIQVTMKECEKKVIKNDLKIAISDEDMLKAESILKEFLNNFFSLNGFKDYNIDFKHDSEYLRIVIDGKGINSFIGYKGDTLEALQIILKSIVRVKLSGSNIRVLVDICGYKEERKKYLEELADRVAKSVIEKKRQITLDPMKAYERKIVHAKLQEYLNIETRSIGEEPRRRIVVSLIK